MEQFDLVAVGSATVDLFFKIETSNPHFKFNEETNELSMKLGEKVVLDRAELLTGGNANNVSIGVKRLGFKTALVAEIGDDEFAHKILSNLEKEGVDATHVLKGNSETSFSVILNYKDDRTIFTRKPEREHNFNLSDVSTKWIYLTSLGNKWENAYRKVFELVSENALNLAFNPGEIQIEKGLGGISYILRKTDILILNKEEAVTILNSKLQIANSKDEIKNILFELKNFGPKIVVITDGGNGSYAVDQERKVHFEKAEDVEVVSKTGAGDAYSTGFLGATLSSLSVKDAMRWGSKNAASVLSKIGAQTGLLSSI